MYPTLVPLLLLSGFLLAGCADSNPQSTFNSQTGSHPSNWLPAAHKTAAMPSTEACAQCHGADYGGGISKLACTQCHLGDQNSVHPTQWGTQTAAQHASYVQQNGTTSCANIYCHGANLGGVEGSGPSCTQCHMGGVYSIHPTQWGSQTAAQHGSYVTANGSSACANASCHGPNLDGVGGTGPSCTQCHLGGTYLKHPVEWGIYAYALHSDYVKLKGTTGCATASCHGPNLDGVGGTGPSCTQCHLGGINSFHPTAWNTNYLLHRPYVGSNGDSSCRNAACHGANLQGVYLSGPACQLCHQYIDRSGRIGAYRR